jgi:sporulation-control protein
MFSRMLSAFGVGGPAVDVVLDAPRTAPGEFLTGQVHVQGGRTSAEIDRVVLSLVTSGETGYHTLHRLVVRQSVRVSPGQVVSIPFRLQVPWETPVTAVGGVWLPGGSVGVRTGLVVAGALVQGGLEVVRVEPAAGQARVLDVFRQLGFRLRRTGADVGHLPGVRYVPGLHQKLEFLPRAECVGPIELILVAGPDELHVILEAGRGDDAPFGLFHVTHQAVCDADWFVLIGQWLAQVGARTVEQSGFLHRVEFTAKKG